METISIDRFPQNTSILLKEDFLKELKDGILLEDKPILKQNTRGFRNLGKILMLCKKYKISLHYLEKSVLSYRTTLGRVTVVNPILPVRVTPLFDMLIAHAMGDGFCSHLQNRIPAFVYRQSRNEILDLFLTKMNSVFGQIIYKENYFYRQKHIYMPSVASYILYSHYLLKPGDFLENNSRVPLRMFKHSKEHLLAVLIAFILDEGHVDSNNIVIGLYNRGLLFDIKKICDMLNYDTKVTEIKGRSYLYILSEGVRKFWEDYIKLKTSYQEVHLDYKEKLIESFILRKEKFWKASQQGETQNKIIALLKESNKTVKELSTILDISRQGAKWHLRQLEKLGIIKCIGKGYAGSGIYKLSKYVILPVKRKGRARQYGVTNERIIKLLKRNPMSTREIADEIKINRATTFHFMLNLETAGKVKKLGKKIHKTHPSIIWTIAQTT